MTIRELIRHLTFSDMDEEVTVTLVKLFPPDDVRPIKKGIVLHLCPQDFGLVVNVDDLP